MPGDNTRCTLLSRANAFICRLMQNKKVILREFVRAIASAGQKSSPNRG